jgi:RecG-like helicase
VPQLDLDPEITSLKGVGPHRGEVLAAHGIGKVGRLLFYFPRKYVDRSEITGASLRVIPRLGSTVSLDAMRPTGPV